MSSIVVSGDTSGAVTLSAPAVAGTVTVTLPSASGTMAVTGGSPSFAALTVTGDATIDGLTVGQGGGNVATNTAVGASALAANTTGNFNAAGGYQALILNAGGQYNTAFGAVSLAANAGGTDNSAFGTGALNANTSGSYNTGLGRSALQSNTTASNNTAVGYQAGYSQTTGGASAGYNAYFGQNAGYASTGYQNTLIGRNAGSAITTGNANTILGQYNGNQGGVDIRTASNIIVLSDGDGNPRAYRDATTWILSGATKTSEYFWAAGIGTAGGLYLGSAGSSNGLISQGSSGTGTTTTYIGNAAITTVSDVRLKENIVDTQRNALNILDQLRVVDHTWNDPSDQCENNRNSRGTWMGLIAQEAQPVIPWLVNKPTADVDENGDPQYWHMDYGYAVPLLVKAIQELKAEVDSLKAQINGASA